ncbi:MAG: phosphoglycerate dehydrogenase [Vampirovibrionia bacterium]
MAFKVLVTDKINEIAVKILETSCEVDYKPVLSAEELKAIIADYDGLMIRSASKVTKEIIDAANNLKIVGRAGVGVDNVDLEAATDKGIVVINSPEGNTVAAAEHTVAIMLSMARHIPQADKSIKEGKWERSKLTGIEVFKKTLGLIGLGKIGGWVAKIAVSMGMNVIVYDPFVTQEQVEHLGAKYAKSLDEMWPVVDFLTMHVPKTRETMHLINKHTLNRMKKGVKIINCARGGIIDEAALADAIKEGQVAMAAIDVFSEEPVKDSPLLELGDKVVLTPHLGASTEEAQINVAVDVAEQIRDMAKGFPVKSAVNIPSLKAELLDPVKHYMEIAEKLGALVRQITPGATKSIEVVACGDLASKKISPLSIAVTKGVLSCSTEGVNYVNAPIIAKRKDIHVTEAKSTDSSCYISLLKVILKTDESENVVTGTVIGNNNPKILRIDGYLTDIEPASHMLVLPHTDKPGMIAKVATLLGKDNINISMMQVGRKDRGQAGGESCMVLNIDDPVTKDIIEELKNIEGIKSAKYISL